jgi:hypothetical protein
VQPLPKDLHGVSAISICGDDTYLYGPYAHKRAVFRLGADRSASLLGERSGPLRGLRSGRFLARANTASPWSTAPQLANNGVKQTRISLRSTRAA